MKWIKHGGGHAQLSLEGVLGSLPLMSEEFIPACATAFRAPLGSRSLSATPKLLSTLTLAVSQLRRLRRTNVQQCGGYARYFLWCYPPMLYISRGGRPECGAIRGTNTAPSRPTPRTQGMRRTWALRRVWRSGWLSGARAMAAAV